jgi:hypothetical protein
MELYVVVDKETNKQIGTGFTKKAEAKTKRNELQGKTKAGMPKETPENQSLWSFKVAYGKDHPKNVVRH